MLGSYRLVERLGEGGMGEVWRAWDERLARDVALKALTPGIAEDDRQRLRAEARAISALHHPHIVVAHDLVTTEDRDVLVMEYVDGEELGKRIPPEGMSLATALPLLIPIADALASAHAAGVTHGDLKPSNILVTRTGAPKVVDFGVARRRAPASLQQETMAYGPESELPGLTGTPTYMAPEQVEGQQPDPRSDVFSFGSLLYELLSGRSPFERASIPATLAAVLHDQPAYPPGWPSPVTHILERCLRKRADRRFQSIADVRVELEELREALERGDLNPPHAARPRPWPVVGPLLLVAAAVAAAVASFSGHDAEAPPWRVVPLTTLPGREQMPALAPDGEQVAFMWDGGPLNNQDIYVQHVDAATPALRLTSTDASESSPTWSPDGKRVAFLRTAFGTTDLISVSALGGAERRIARVAPLSFSQVSVLPPTNIDWSPDGKWIAVGGPSLSLVAVDTGEVVKIPQSTRAYDKDPAFSPDERAVAFSRGPDGVHRQLWVQPLDPAGRPQGAATLVAAPFRAYFGLTWGPEGRLLTAAGAPGSTVTLFRVTSDQHLQPFPVEPTAAWYPSYSITRQRLAYQRRTIDIDVFEVALDASAPQPQPLIASTYQDGGAKYSPDGTRVVFISTRTGEPAVWRANNDGTNQVLIGVVESGTLGSPNWSPDGQSIVFDASSPAAASDLFIVSADGGTPRRLTSGTGSETSPSFSRDGRWVYFSSEGHIFKVPAGGGETIRTSMSGVTVMAASDGFLYFDRDSAVWRVRSDTDAESLVLRDVPSNGWTIAGDELYFLVNASGERAHLDAFHLATHVTRTVAQFGSHLVFFAGGWPHVSADGRHALMNLVTRDESDLMLVDHVR